MTDTEAVLAILGADGMFQPDIAYALALPIRTVQAALQELRLAGHPIISDAGGVRLAQTAEEARTCADSLRRRAIHQLLTSRAVRRTARRMREAEDAAVRLTLWEVST